MDENKRRFLATAVLVAMEDQWTMFAQGIASYFQASGSDPTEVFSEMGGLYDHITDLMSNGVTEKPIWPELLPGGNQTNDLLPLLEQLATYGPFKSTATEGMKSVQLLIEAVESGQLRGTIIEGRIKKYLEGHDVSDMAQGFKYGSVDTEPNNPKHVNQVIQHIAHLSDEQIADIREHLVVWDTPDATLLDRKNIKLDFPVSIYLDDGTVYFAKGIEFFRDENGNDWMKFFPKNGPDHGEEHIVSHGRLSHIVRKP